MVGLGTQDTFAEAQDFREEHGVSFPFLWDESFVSWRELGNTGQPAAVLFAADGTELARWSGMYDEREVLEAIGQ